MRKRAVCKKDLVGKPGKKRTIEDINIARTLAVKWLWKK